jgi:hypothetical protein
MLISFLVADGQEVLMRPKPDPSVPPFGVQLKKSVVQIDLKCRDGNLLVQGGGTGFVLAISDSRLPKGSSFLYLVTNRHVAQCWDDPEHLRDVLTESIRVNLKSGSSKSYSLDTGAWTFPTDDSVDLAVMPLTFPKDDDLDMYSLDFSDPGTKDYLHSHRIAEGSPVLISGFFVQYPGVQKFQSIVRQGIVSMMPDEPIKTTMGKLGTLYLADVHIFLGNSGSPVMVAEDAIGVGGYHLLGVVSGYVYEDANFKVEIATTTTGKVSTNSGIAIIVPVDFLKALLDSPKLKDAREHYLSSLASPSAETKH